MPNSDAPLRGKVALVTGGSGGVGAASCAALSRLGADLVLTYHSNHDAAQDVARRSERDGVSVATIRGDISTADGVRDMVADVRAHAPDIDIVVANAESQFPLGRLVDVDPEILGANTSADLVAFHTLATSFLPPMRERRFGRLLAMSSVHALGPTAPGMAAHGIGKAALEGYIRYAADEFGLNGVTVNALRLGFVDTKATSAVPTEARELLTAAIPAGRLGTPDDIGAVVALLAQPSAAWINGAVIPAAGGLNNPLPLSRLLGWTRAERPAS
jgi:NAD(P)-dependent dehydrogenase (short-subunit alcohol dehydrogenase family)